MGDRTLNAAMVRCLTATEAFGANAWLVDDMYEQYRQDPTIGERELAGVLRGLPPGRGQPGPTVVTGPPARRCDADPRTVMPAADEPAGGDAGTGARPRRGRRHPPAFRSLRQTGRTGPRAPARPVPPGVQAPHGRSQPQLSRPRRAGCGAPPVAVVANMTASLEVPTATSFRVVPARLLEVNRASSTISSTAPAAPARSASPTSSASPWSRPSRPYRSSTRRSSPLTRRRSQGRRQSVVHHEHIGLGIAVDIERPGRQPNPARARHQGRRTPSTSEVSGPPTRT